MEIRGETCVRKTQCSYGAFFFLSDCSKYTREKQQQHNYGAFYWGRILFGFAAERNKSFFFALVTWRKFDWYLCGVSIQQQQLFSSPFCGASRWRCKALSARRDLHSKTHSRNSENSNFRFFSVGDWCSYTFMPAAATCFMTRALKKQTMHLTFFSAISIEAK